MVKNTFGQMSSVAQPGASVAQPNDPGLSTTSVQTGRVMRALLTDNELGAAHLALEVIRVRCGRRHIPLTLADLVVACGM